MTGLKQKLENYIKFSSKIKSDLCNKRSVVKHIERKNKHQLWEDKRTQNSQRKKKVKESSIDIDGGELKEKG